MLKAKDSESWVATKSWHRRLGPRGCAGPFDAWEDPMRAMACPSHGEVNSSAPLTSMPSVW